MSKYQSKKTVDAVPMSREEAEKTLGRSISTVGSNTPDDGYFVTYESGYKSWCPKDTFESSNAPIDTVSERLALERDDVQDRLSKLCCFMDTEDYLDLSPGNRVLIEMQKKSMQDYRDILDARIDMVRK